MATDTDLRRSRLVRRRRGARPGSGPPDPTAERGDALALVELARGVGADWEAAIRRILQTAADVLRVDRVSFWSLSEETASIRCDHGYVASRRTFERGATIIASEAPEYFAALREGRSLAIADVRTDPRCGGLREYCVARGIASMLDVPVWAEGRLGGVLCHEQVGVKRRWTDRDQVFAAGVGQVVASALVARAHTRAEALALRANLLDGGSRVLASLDSRAVARGAASLCVPSLADVALLWVLDADGDLECIALEHTAPGAIERVSRRRLPLASRAEHELPTLAGLVVRQRQSLLIPDVHPSVVEHYRISPDDRAALDSLGIRTAMGVPLAVPGNTFGALILGARARRYDAEDLALAEDVAARVGAALENARLYEVAKEAIRARDELLLIAGHELRTPLTALQLMTDRLLRATLPNGSGAVPSAVDGIARQVRRFGALIDHMLDALSIRAAGVRLAPARCDLAAIVKGEVRRAADLAPGGITLDCPPEVTGQLDEVRVAQVVRNLLENAVKFGGGKPIDVTLSVDGGEAVLSVRDRGVGIPADRLSSIFHPFERAVPKEHYGGLGLGLYVAKAIVDAHQGSIAVASAPGEGSTFTVRLPLGG
jgi:signal transduction histidine kinase